MLDHVSIFVSDLKTSKAFYTAILAPMGIAPLMEFPGVIGYGREGSGAPQFWIGVSELPSRGGHIAFQAPSRESVRRFHAAGLKTGGRDEGLPGLRPQYHEHYYAAFLFDPDGYKVEAVIHKPE
jgi:catechol 2,3-dioxygenase-like lactoylglutathione lyase family enzyme